MDENLLPPANQIHPPGNPKRRWVGVLLVLVGICVGVSVSYYAVTFDRKEKVADRCSILTGLNKDRCFTSLALKYGNPDWCEYISERRDSRENCMELVGVQNSKAQAVSQSDPSLCKALEGRDKSECVRKLAAATKDPGLCELLPNDPQAWRDNCYVEIAPLTGDYKNCEPILVTKDDDGDNYAKPHNYQNCRMFVSMAIGDIKTCRSIENPDDQNLKELIAMVEGETDPELKATLEADIAELRDSYKVWCTLAIAVKKRDKSLCGLLPETVDDIFSRSMCVQQVSACISDSSKCDD